MSDKIYNLALVMSAQLNSQFGKTFDSARKTLSAYQTATKAAADGQRTLDKVMAQREAVTAAQQAYQQATATLGALQAQMRDGKASATLKAQMREAEQAVKSATTALERQQSALAKLHAATGTGGQSIADLTARQAQLQAQADAATSRHERAQSIDAIAGTGQSLRQSGMSGLTGAYVQVAGLKQLAEQVAGPIVRLGMEFDSTMSKVAAVSGATGQELDALRATAQKLGESTSWSASQAAEGMTYLAMSGFKAEQTIAAMPGMLDLATAAGASLATTADIASNVLTGFGMKAEEMGKVGDILTSTFTTSNTTLESLGSALSKVAPVASGLGVPLEQVAAMLGKLGDVGLQAENAGTAVKIMLNNLASPAKAGKEALAALGIQTADAEGRLRPMPDILREMSAALAASAKDANAAAKLQEGMADMTETELEQAVNSAYGVDAARQIKAIFGSESMSAAMALLTQASTGSLHEYEQSLLAAGKAAQTAATMGNNLEGDTKTLQSATEALYLSLYENLEPTLRTLTQEATAWIRRVKDWAANNYELIRTLVSWAPTIAAVVGVLIALKAAMAAVTLAAGAILGPFAAVFKVVTALGPAFTLISAAGGKVIALLASLGPVLTTILTGFKALAAAMLANPMLLVLAALGAALYVLWDNWEQVWGWIREAWDAVTTWLTDSIFTDLAAGAGAALTALWDTWQTIWGYIRGAWDAAKAWLADSPITAMADAALGALGELWDGWQTIWGGIKDTWDSVSSFFGDIGDSVVSAFTSTPTVPEVPQAAVQAAQTIPALANGGIVDQPTLALIGEQGPEAVMPLSQVPAPASTGDIRVEYQPQITIAVSDGQDIKQTIVQVMQQQKLDLRRELEELMARQSRTSYA